MKNMTAFLALRVNRQNDGVLKTGLRWSPTDSFTLSSQYKQVSAYLKSKSERQVRTEKE